MSTTVSGTHGGSSTPPEGTTPREPAPRPQGTQSKTSTQGKSQTSSLLTQPPPPTASLREGEAEQEGYSETQESNQGEGFYMWTPGENADGESLALPQAPAPPTTTTTTTTTTTKLLRTTLPLPQNSEHAPAGKEVVTSAAMMTLESAPFGQNATQVRSNQTPTSSVARALQTGVADPHSIPAPPPPPPGGFSNTVSDPAWAQVLSKRGPNLPTQNERLWEMLIENPNKQDAYAKRSQIRKVEHELKVKMNKILFLILMGDVAGAVREMIHQEDMFSKIFNRMLVKNLNRSREGKAKVILALGRKSPPMMHPSTGNKQTDEAETRENQQFTQWTTLTSQLLGTMQEQDRELSGIIDEGRRGIKELKEAYKGLKEAETRTNRPVYQALKG